MRILASLFVSATTIGQVYVDAQSGLDANPGTSELPYRTLDKVESVMADGMTVRLSGTFYDNLVLTGLDNATIEQWAGMSPVVLRGDVPCSGWQQDGHGWYCASSGSVSAVVVDWDNTILTDGRHAGFLTPTPDVGTMVVTANSYFYDSALNRIYVNVGTDSPLTLDIRYTRTGFDGVRIESGTNVTVDGLTSILWTDRTPGSGYGIKMKDCVGSTLRNHTVIDCGYHGTGWVNYTRTNSNNTEENGQVWGANNDSCYVFYSQSTDVSGARIDGCTAYKYTFLGRDGQPIRPTDRCVGFAWHTSGSSYITDLQLTDCHVVEYSDMNLGAAFASKHTLPGSASNDWNDYPVRIVECSVTNGKKNLYDPSRVAYVRCRLDYPMAGVTDNAESVFGDNATGGPGSTLFDACEIVCNLDGAGPRSFFGVRTLAGMRFINTSVLETGVNSSSHRMFAWYNSTAGIVAHGSVFGFANNNGIRMLHYGDTNSSQQSAHDYNDCVYSRVTDGYYSSLSAINAASEWILYIDDSLLESGKVFAYEDGSRELVLSNGTDARESVVPLSVATTLGINQVQYSGTYGANQHLACSADINADGFVTGDDYDLFSEWFDDGDIRADYNQDDFVTGDDFDAYVFQFEGC